METLKFEQDGHVGWLRLNRPEKLNAMTPELWIELREFGQRLVADPGDLRCLIVMGEGRSFSAGIDLSTFGRTDPLAGSSLSADMSGLHDDPAASTVLFYQQAFTWLEDLPVPAIAAVRGYALGAGIQLAAACDIRVMAKGTKLGVFEQKYGILPDLGGTHWLPRIVGAAKAKELTWTVAEFDAEEAHRIGLCDHLVDDADLEKTAQQIATTIAAQPPLAVAGAKAAINLAAAGADRGTVLRATAERQAVCLRSKDFGEAITAFTEKRAPEYTGE